MSTLERALYKVFSEYSMQANTYKQPTLRINRLVDLYRDAELFTEDFTPTHLHLLLHSVNSRNPQISFRKFCELTGNIAERRYPEEYRVAPSESYELLASDHLLLLSGRISQELSVMTKWDLNISNNVTLLAQDLEKSFRVLFLQFFSWEAEGGLPLDQMGHKSLQQLEKLLKLFDIYPSLINKVKLHGLWRDVVVLQDGRFREHLADAFIPRPQHDIGTVLTLSKFVLILYLCSVHGCQEALGDQGSTEKFLHVLDRVQSAVCRDFKGLRLVPSKAVLGQVRNHEGEKSSQPLLTEETADSFTPPFEQESLSVLERHSSKLQTLYSSYASMQPFMKKAAFLMVLKDSHVVDTLISRTDSDLIYAKITAKGVMDFMGFLKAVELVAKKVAPSAPLQEAVEDLLEERLLRADCDRNRVSIVEDYRMSKAMEELQEQPISEALAILHKPLFYFYSFYADLRGELNYKSMVQFCRDFEIFPDIFSQNRIKKMFSYLINKEKTGLLEEFQARGNIFTFNVFVDSLVLMSTETYANEELGQIEKLSCFIEMIFQSKGPTKIYRQLGHSRLHGDELIAALQEIRSRFPSQFYHSSNSKVTFVEYASRFI